MPYKNKITITIADVDLEAGSIELHSSFDQTPDIEYGPQTPAEEVAALMMTFAQRNVLKEHNVGAILLPEEWQTEAFGGGGD